MSYAKSLERYDNEELQAMFRFVIKDNEGWRGSDDIVAVGDYGNHIKYAENSKPEGYIWEKYVPEKIAPKKLDESE